VTEQPQRDERDLNEFWWKIGSVAIAVMVWFIITTVAGLSYTNRGRDGKQPVPKQPTTNAPPLTNPELNGGNNEPDDETNE
jgi:hypothetical protein